MSMLAKLYARWMYRWETDLTTRDTNRIVRPVEWGFDWLEEFARAHGFPSSAPADDAEGERMMLRLNDFILHHRAEFYAYQTPSDFVLEERHPQLFPTNVRPETLKHDARVQRLAAQGKLGPVARLMPTTAATTIRSAREQLVIDGPFAETKEQLLGFYIVDRATLEEAIDAAGQIKRDEEGGAFEIRPLRYFDPGANPKGLS